MENGNHRGGTYDYLSEHHISDDIYTKPMVPTRKKLFNLQYIAPPYLIHKY